MKKDMERYDKIVPAAGSTAIACLLIMTIFLSIMAGGAQIIEEGNGSGEILEHAIYLSIEENPAGNLDSWAKYRIPMDMDFDSIMNFSFTYKLLDGSRTPRMTLELDTNGDNRGDIWINQWTNETETGEWMIYSKDDWYTYPPEPIQLTHNNLSSIQDEIEGTLIAVKVVIGQWTYTDAHKVLISSIKINNNELLPEPEPTPTLTPTLTPETVYIYRGGSGGYPRDTDGDGISDVKEMLAGTNWKDPCDPNPDCTACLIIRPPTPTPIITSVPTATPIIPVETPVPAEITKPTPTPEPEIPGFEVVFAILGLLTVVYFWMRRKERRNN